MLDQLGTSVRNLLAGLARRALSLKGRSAQGYLAAIAGVGAVSGCIAIIQQHARIENISLLYLLVVLWLATQFGRGPAIVASVLAFLTYDFLFIPPLYRLTVDDPTEWISLFALLATSLVLGQLTAAVQFRARQAISSQREAQASQERTQSLYVLAQLSASTSDTPKLLVALAERLIEVFGATGVGACSILLPDAIGRLTTYALVPADHPLGEALRLQLPECLSHANWTMQQSMPVGQSVGIDVTGSDSRRWVYFLPLLSGRRCVGVLGIGGTPSIRQLIPARQQPDRHLGESSRAVSDGFAGEAGATLLAAFCDQIALAIERGALQQQAVHAEALRQSDRLKSSLLGSVTHDLRTPLAAIQAAAESLLDTEVTWTESERREFVRSITSSTTRLSRLVNNLLDLSRLEAGGALPRKEWYDFSDVVTAALDQFESTSRTQNRNITVEFPNDLPLVPLDHEQMEQVMTNLIDNALKYSATNSPVVISARMDESAAMLEIHVKDHGIGIPPQEREAVFDKFYRIQNLEFPWRMANTPAGTGLGLAICAEIVRGHGGRIWVESEPGRWSDFVFTLPVPENDRMSLDLPEVPASEPADPVDGVVDTTPNHHDMEARIS